MSKSFGAYYSVYKNKKATEFVLENFRTHFPEECIVLFSDGGDDFSDIASRYNCHYFWTENLYGNDENKYPILPYNSLRMKLWWERQKRVCDISQSDYVMILEDDVFVKSSFEINDNFFLRGARIGNFFSAKMINDIHSLGEIEGSNKYGMCGGSFYNVSVFQKIYDDVISDIIDNHDDMLNDPEYFLLGAVDANITYHFNKRGYRYEDSPWLVEVREGDLGDYPIVHQWKENY